MSGSRSCTFRLSLSDKQCQIGQTLLPVTTEMSREGFRLVDLNLTMTYSKCQLGSWNGVSPNILTFSFSFIVTVCHYHAAMKSTY